MVCRCGSVRDEWYYIKSVWSPATESWWLYKTGKIRRDTLIPSYTFIGSSSDATYLEVSTSQVNDSTMLLNFQNRVFSL